MPRDVDVYLNDIKLSCEAIVEFTRDKSFEDYQRTRMLRSAVERELSIIGEAVGQVLKVQPELRESLTDAKRIVGFRNVVIHAYATLSDARVWQIVQRYVPRLHTEVQALLERRQDT